MVISESQPPPELNHVHTWERSKDPFHAAALPANLEWAGTTGERKGGWMGLDYYANPVCFVADGEIIEDKLYASQQS